MKNKGFKKIFIRLLMYKPWLFVVGVLCNILIFSYAAAQAYCIRIIFNMIELEGVENILTKTIPFLIGILVFALIRVGAIKISAVNDNLQRFYYNEFLRNNIFKIIYKSKNLKSIAGKSEKTFEILANDVQRTRYPSTLLAEVTGFTVYTLIAIGSLLIVNWKVTVFIFIPISVAMIIIKSASKKIKENRKVNREINEKVSERIGDIAKGVQTAKVLGAEDNIVKSYEKLNSKRLSVTLKDTLFESGVWHMISSTVHMGTAVMMLLVARSMMRGEFLIGDFSMFVCFLGSLASCVDRVNELIIECKQGEVSYNRITDLIGIDNQDELRDHVELRAFKKSAKFEYKDMKKTPLKELEVKGLSYSYDDSTCVRDLNFRIKPGMTVALAGGVGSGKSTVINLLMGIIPKDTGKILWNGKEIKDQSEFFVPPNVSYTPQISKMFSTSLRDNLLMGKDEDDKKIQEAFYNAVFDEDFQKIDGGIDTELGSSGDRLSGGQKQRVALARMFMNDADLYVMDDSTSALDTETEKKFWERYNKNMKKKKFACIIATNKKQVLERADMVLLLKDGQIIDSGKAEELSKRSLDFKKIYA